MTRLSLTTPCLLVLWTTWLGGCIVGGDSGVRDPDAGPQLAVDLYWDELSEPNQFFGGTCDSAEVETMQWKLLNPKGEEVDNGSEDCSEVLGVPSLDPAEYRLEIRGMNSAGQTRWESTCSGLLLVRFDSRHLCDVPSS